MEYLRQFIKRIINEAYDQFNKPPYLYYGITKRSAYGIKKMGEFGKPPASHAIISFTDDIQTAKFIAFRKNGNKKGLILRTKSVNLFEPSEKYPGSWNLKETRIPVSDLEIMIDTEWKPLTSVDPFEIV